MIKNKIIGIASLPERVECLRDTVNSLLPQVDKIIVGLNNYTKVPNFLNHPKIEAYLLDNSLGDAAKFYKVGDYKDSYYLSCDDDLIYPVNDTAQKFSNLLGKKTFSKIDLAIIGNLGYKITQVMEELI